MKHIYQSFFQIQYLSVLAFALLSSFGFGQLSTDKLAAARAEFANMESLEFIKADVDSFLVAPAELAAHVFFHPRWWSEVKDEFNFRGNDIPRGVRLSSGDPEEIQSEQPENWNPNDFYLQKQVSLSPTGDILEYMNRDSTVFSYNEFGLIRQMTGYSLMFPGAVDYNILYNYAPYGNLLWTASYLNTGDKAILDEYETFRYLSTDSGFYVRNDAYLVFDDEIPELNQMINFHFYNPEGQRLFTYFGTDGIARNFITYEYQEVEGNYYTSKITEYDLERNGLMILEKTTLRDDKARIVFEKKWGYNEVTPYEARDSIIYVSDIEKHVYKKTPRGPYPNALIVYKLDEHGNVSRREIHDLNSDDPEKIEILTTYRNFYLENGNVHQIVDVTYWDGRKDRDLYIQEFLTAPIGNHNPTYKDDPILISLIEKCIPPDKR